MDLPVGDDELTVGVEEEFILVDLRSGRLAPRSPAVLADIAAHPDQVQFEFSQYQVETSTPVCRSVDEAADHLERLRAIMVSAAARQGAQPIGTGTPVLPYPMPPARVDAPRYHRIAREFGSLTDTHTMCGCHVHVGIADRAVAVDLSNHLRGWLPLLLALSANSPFSDGRDTGYASWRAVLLSRWPGAGIPPVFSSVADYERAVSMLVASGAALDRAMVYWHIRPSHHLPTLEIRVFDAPGTVTEAALFAALSRALVGTALRDIRAGRAAPMISQHDLHVAVWSAARTGLGGPCFDPLAGGVVSAGEAIAVLLEYVRPALAASGDLARVLHGLSFLRRNGSGASRQRRAFARRGLISDVVDGLREEMSGTAALPIPASRTPDS